MTPITIRECLQQAKEKLSGCAVDPFFEAQVLLAFVIQEPRSYLHAWPEKGLTDNQAEQFAAALARLCRQEPMAYVTGVREFWSLPFTVTPATLIPRPETETLVETVLNRAGGLKPALKVADLGTGSGAIALALAHERPAWQIYATDISESALQIASKNAQQLRIENVSFYQGSWCTALPRLGFDMIVSNPPYIAETEWPAYVKGLAFEPVSALVSGVDGLDAIRVISLSAKDYLNSDGYLLIEHGFLQGQAVRDLLMAEGYDSVCSVCDFSGQERVTLGRHK